MGGEIFEVPVSCLPGVAEVYGGQYPVFSFGKPEIVILDIGANCGAWSMLMRRQFPQAEIHAYEPHPDIYGVLVGNVSRHGVKCHRAAVGDPKGTRFFCGRDTGLCGSQFDLGRQDTERPIEVPTLDAGLLPRADLVKIDTEGAEAEILSRLEFRPAAVIVEWHSQALRRECEVHLQGMDLVYCRVHGQGWGVSAYVAPGGGQ